MPRVFEVGKEYEPYQHEFEPIRVLRRTEKTIWVENSATQWRMRIKHDAQGNEYVIDSIVPYKWRDAFTYFA